MCGTLRQLYLFGDHLLYFFVGFSLVPELGHHDGELLAGLLDDESLRHLDVGHREESVL